MARIQGIFTADPDLFRKLDGTSAGEPAPGAPSKRGTKECAGFRCAWTGATKEPLYFENDAAVVFGEANIFSIDGSSASAGAFLAEALQRGALAEALGKLNADFALAVFDKKRRLLSLARDRFGIKPLYFARKGESIGFASLPMAAGAAVGLRAVPRRSYVARFLASHYRYFDNDPELSPYEEISQVAPGQLVVFSASGTEKKPYWTLKDRGDLDVSESDLAEQYRALLSDAVKIRLKAVPDGLAFTLSGGMDSSSVMASAVKVLGKKLVAYSSVYEDKTYDESDDIKTMLDLCVSDWHPVKIDVPDTFGIIDRMVRVHQEPVVTATWLSHFLLCEQAAHEGVHGFFGGMGGDELNAGEYEYFWHFFADLRAAGDQDKLAEEIDGWVKYHNHPIYKKSRSVVDATLPKMADLSIPGRILADEARLHKYTSALDPSYFDPREFHPFLLGPFRSYLKNRCFQDLAVETIPPCLRAEDRHGAYFGIENFLPFLDHRLVELMFQVQGTRKFRKGVTKHILREAMKGTLPEETRTRVKKTGWNAPAHVWFSGTGREALLDMIHSRQFRERGLYNVPEIERLVNEHEEIVKGNLVKENHMMFLWQLVNLELWLKSL